MTTPRIIWQTWKSKKDLPPNFQKYTSEWKRLHPGWKHVILDDNDLRNIVKTHLPSYLGTYDGFLQNIERVDFARYALLYVYGGVYADMDMVPLTNFEKWTSKNQIVLGREPLSHSRRLYWRDVVLCNALMISPPRQQYWLSLMDYIAENTRKWSVPVYNTGPMAMTRHMEDNTELFGNIIITDPCVFYPLQADKTISPECKGREADAVHIWTSTWSQPWYKHPGLKYYAPLLLGLGVVLILAVMSRSPCCLKRTKK